MILMAAIWQDNARSLSCAKILKVEKFINMANISFVKWPSGHAQSFLSVWIAHCICTRVYRSMPFERQLKHHTLKLNSLTSADVSISRNIGTELQWPVANKLEGFEGSTVCLKNIAHFFYLGGHLHDDEGFPLRHRNKMFIGIPSFLKWFTQYLVLKWSLSFWDRGDLRHWPPSQPWPPALLALPPVKVHRITSCSAHLVLTHTALYCCYIKHLYI